jgi:hypothetical protein
MAQDVWTIDSPIEGHPAGFKPEPGLASSPHAVPRKPLNSLPTVCVAVTLTNLAAQLVDVSSEVLASEALGQFAQAGFAVKPTCDFGGSGDQWIKPENRRKIVISIVADRVLPDVRDENASPFDTGAVAVVFGIMALDYNSMVPIQSVAPAGEIQRIAPVGWFAKYYRQGIWQAFPLAASSRAAVENGIRDCVQYIIKVEREDNPE